MTNALLCNPVDEGSAESQKLQDAMSQHYSTTEDFESTLGDEDNGFHHLLMKSAAYRKQLLKDGLESWRSRRTDVVEPAVAAPENHAPVAQIDHDTVEDDFARVTDDASSDSYVRRRLIIGLNYGIKYTGGCTNLSG